MVSDWPNAFSDQARVRTPIAAIRIGERGNLNVGETPANRGLKHLGLLVSVRTPGVIETAS